MSTELDTMPQRRVRRKKEAVGSRIRLVVDRVHEGNVSEAAARTGVSQRTLQRLFAGVTAIPRADVVQQLIAQYGGTFEWWLDGSGEPAEVLRDEVPHLSVAGLSNTAEFGAHRVALANVAIINLVESLGLDPHTTRGVFLR